MKLFYSLLIPLLIGSFSGWLSNEGIENWYATLEKPVFNPPNWIFAPVWTLLYLLMGFGLWRVLLKPKGWPGRTEAIWVFSIQLLLNFCWSILFFRFQAPGWALADLFFLWVAVLGMIYFFSKVERISGWLQIPYIGWISFAGILNFYIWKLNT